MYYNNPFSETKIYSLDEIAKIACNNGMTTIDCIKDENIVSLEGFDGKDMFGTNVFEFDMVDKNKLLFKMKWFEPKWRDYIHYSLW